MSAPALQKTKTGKLTNREVVSYALGDVANNVAFMMTSMFLMVYMTDIAGLSAGIAGVIYGVTKIWAGFTDLFAGQVVGRKETRWGRLRPWVMFGSFPLIASLVLLFSKPLGLTGASAVAWIFLFDAAFQLCYSMVNIPYGSLSAAMTQDPVDRSRLSGGRAIGSAVTGVILASVLSPQFQIKGATPDMLASIQGQFTLTTIILGVVAILLYFLMFRGTKEVIPAGAEKVTLRSTFKMVGQNPPLLVLCITAIFTLTAMFTLQATQMYYARNVVGNASYFTFFMIASTIGTILIAGFAPALTQKLGKKNAYVLAALLGVVAYVIIGLTPIDQSAGALVIALVAFFIYGLGSGGTNAMTFSMQADTVDYGEWKTGVRSEGGSYSILSFSRKMGQGIGGFVGGGVIAAFGYDGQLAQQSAETLQGIKVAAGWIPAALLLIAAIIIFFYPLSADKHATIVADLTERRALRGAVKLVAGAPVVTLNEEYGAGEEYVGKKVAEALGIPFTGLAFSSTQLEEAEAAAQVRADQDSATTRWLSTFGKTGVDSDSGVAANAEADSRQVKDNIAFVVETAQSSGGVILGHDATVILKDMQGALHVRLVAPQQDRIQRAVTTLGISPEVAAERLEREDRVRVEMSRRLSAYDQTDPKHYDLVINTSETSLDDAADQIVRAYRAKYPAK